MKIPSDQVLSLIVYGLFALAGVTLAVGIVVQVWRSGRDGYDNNLEKIPPSKGGGLRL